LEGGKEAHTDRGGLKADPAKAETKFVKGGLEGKEKCAPSAGEKKNQENEQNGSWRLIQNDSRGRGLTQDA